MSKEYVTFITNLDDLTEGRELQLTIRDLTPGPRKYDARVVKARLSHSTGKPAEGDTLWVRSWTGALYPQPWSMVITEEVGEVLPGRPHGETLATQG
jgi:hypothetical protein